MPAFSHCSTSVGLIGREASEMSVSPAQNFLKPPPVPEMPTVTCTFGATLRNSSATASVIGKTVLDPSTAMRPERSAANVSPARPVSRSAAAILRKPIENLHPSKCPTDSVDMRVVWVSRCPGYGGDVDPVLTRGSHVVPGVPAPCCGNVTAA
jgi:hypothetical protein